MGNWRQTMPSPGVTVPWRNVISAGKFVVMLSANERRATGCKEGQRHQLLKGIETSGNSRLHSDHRLGKFYVAVGPLWAICRGQSRPERGNRHRDSLTIVQG